MSLGDVWGLLEGFGPVWSWLAAGMVVLLGLCALVLVLVKWPHIVWIGPLMALAFYGRAHWLIAAMLGIIAFIAYSAVEELERMRHLQSATSGALTELLSAVKRLQKAVEELDPEVKKTREAERREGAERRRAWAAEREREEQAEYEAHEPEEFEVVGTEAPTAKPPRGPGPGNTYAERFGRWLGQHFTGKADKDL